MGFFAVADRLLPTDRAQREIVEDVTLPLVG